MAASAAARRRAPALETVAAPMTAAARRVTARLSFEPTAAKPKASGREERHDAERAPPRQRDEDQRRGYRRRDLLVVDEGSADQCGDARDQDEGRVPQRRSAVAQGEGDSHDRHRGVRERAQRQREARRDAEQRQNVRQTVLIGREDLGLRVQRKRDAEVFEIARDPYRGDARDAQRDGDADDREPRARNADRQRDQRRQRDVRLDHGDAQGDRAAAPARSRAANAAAQTSAPSVKGVGSPR